MSFGRCIPKKHIDNLLTNYRLLCYITNRLHMILVKMYTYNCNNISIGIIDTYKYVGIHINIVFFKQM